jgi:hypothetical protein
MQIIAFEWARCLEGYTIVPRQKLLKEPPAWTRVPKVVPLPRWTAKGAPDAALATAGKQPFEHYRPTGFPALFQRFADMPATAGGMCEFFNNFGPLEMPGGKLPTGPRYHATDLGGVLAHHAALRRALERFQDHDLPGLAKRYNVGWGSLRVELQPSPRGKVVFTLLPSSLIQFLWLQFALHAASDATLLRCVRCGVAFQAGPGTGRRNSAMYCSNACKTGAYKARRAGDQI